MLIQKQQFVLCQAYVRGVKNGRDKGNICKLRRYLIVARTGGLSWVIGRATLGASFGAQQINSGPLIRKLIMAKTHFAEIPKITLFNLSNLARLGSLRRRCQEWPTVPMISGHFNIRVSITLPSLFQYFKKSINIYC